MAEWFRHEKCPGLLADLLDVAEPFGDGLGVILIVLVLVVVDRLRRHAVPRLVACCLGAGLAADVVKLLVARVRPEHSDLADGAWATFGGLLPMLGSGSQWQSFPSAHSATAVGLAIGLSWLYPGGRLLFATLAVLVMGQRLETGAHYPSDVLVGAAVGLLLARSCLPGGRLSFGFDYLERRWTLLKKRPLPHMELPLPSERTAEQLISVETLSEGRESRPRAA